MSKALRGLISATTTATYFTYYSCSRNPQLPFVDTFSLALGRQTGHRLHTVDSLRKDYDYLGTNWYRAFCRNAGGTFTYPNSNSTREFQSIQHGVSQKWTAHISLSSTHHKKPIC